MHKSFKLILLLPFVLWGVLVQSQTVYFDKLYDSGISGIQIEGIGERSVIEHDSGYYFVSITLNPLTDIAYIYFADINEEGTVRDSFVIGEDTLQQLPRNMLMLDDTTFLLFTNAINLNATPLPRSDFRLVCFTLSGNVLWSKFYGEELENEFAQTFLPTSDGGYLLIGYLDINQGQNTDALVIKVDNLGNEEWTQVYGGNEIDFTYSGKETEDGGYLLLGYTYSFGNGNRDVYLIKTDSLGNEEWYKTYGTSNSELGRGMIQLQDGNYLLCTVHVSGGLTQGGLIKIDPLGNVIWQKKYNPPGETESELYWAIELSDNSLVAVGSNYSLSDGNSGWLLKVDSVGEVIWSRKHNKNQHTDLFWSFIKTSDNGYLASGQARGGSGQSQDAWLLKVDSMGCTYPNCTVGIDEVEKKVIVDIWPNPASDVLNLEFQEQYKEVVIELIDISGKVVYSAKESNTYKTQIDVSGFVPGVYVLRVVGNDFLVAEKILVR